ASLMLASRAVSCASKTAARAENAVSMKPITSTHAPAATRTFIYCARSCPAVESPALSHTCQRHFNGLRAVPDLIDSCSPGHAVAPVALSRASTSFLRGLREQASMAGTSGDEPNVIGQCPNGLCQRSLTLRCEASTIGVWQRQNCNGRSVACSAITL